jgi:hypothetical protein
VDPRAGLEAVEKREALVLARNRTPNPRPPGLQDVLYPEVCFAHLPPGDVPYVLPVRFIRSEFLDR